MKKSIIGLFTALLLVITLAGCIGTSTSTITQTSESVALQIVAQRVGYYVAKNNPSIVPQAILVAQGITAAKDGDAAKTALNLAVTALAKQFPNDPLLASDLKIIAAGLSINVPAVKLDTSQLEPFIAAFINGLEIGGSQK